jgi:hypothetical protein
MRGVGGGGVQDLMLLYAPLGEGGDWGVTVCKVTSTTCTPPPIPPIQPFSSGQFRNQHKTPYNEWMGHGGRREGKTGILYITVQSVLWHSARLYTHIQLL